VSSHFKSDSASKEYGWDREDLAKRAAAIKKQRTGREEEERKRKEGPSWWQDWTGFDDDRDEEIGDEEDREDLESFFDDDEYGEDEEDREDLESFFDDDEYGEDEEEGISGLLDQFSPDEIERVRQLINKNNK